MRRNLLLIVAGVAVLSLLGCAPRTDAQKRNAVLEGKLWTTVQERDELRRTCSELQAKCEEQATELTEAKRKEGEMSTLLDQLQQAQKERQDQLEELQKLVRNISGMSIQSRPEGDFIVIENEILFASGSTDLSDGARKTLDDTVVAYLRKNVRRNDQQLIRVDGHSDGEPIKHSQWKDNYHLSAMRAHAVMQYLASQGVPAQNMYIVGFGPNRPLVEPVEPEAPMPKNRRVEILLVPQAQRSIEQILEQFRP